MGMPPLPPIKIPLPMYDYLYPCKDYSNMRTDWIKDQLEMAEEEGATEYILAMKKELAIRNIAHQYNYPVKPVKSAKPIPVTGQYTRESEPFWEWLKSFIPLRLW